MPLLEVQVRDTIVCRGGDGHFYMTGSTGQNILAFNDGVELWKSKDLKKWEYIGLVWSLDKDGTWEKQWRSLHGKPCRAIWAPELHYLRGNYYICLSMAPGGISILKSTTGKPTGPYTHAFSPEKPIVGGIDPTLFEDDDHKVYFTNGSATRIVRLKDDFSGFAEDFHPIVLSDPDHTPSHHAERCVGRGSRDLGTEGAVSLKRMASIIWALRMTTRAVTQLVLQCRRTSTGPIIPVMSRFPAAVVLASFRIIMLAGGAATSATILRHLFGKNPLS